MPGGAKGLSPPLLRRFLPQTLRWFAFGEKRGIAASSGTAPFARRGKGYAALFGWAKRVRLVRALPKTIVMNLDLLRDAAEKESGICAQL